MITLACMSYVDKLDSMQGPYAVMQISQGGSEILTRTGHLHGGWILSHRPLATTHWGCYLTQAHTFRIKTRKRAGDTGLNP